MNGTADSKQIWNHPLLPRTMILVLLFSYYYTTPCTFPPKNTYEIWADINFNITHLGAFLAYYYDNANESLLSARAAFFL